MKKLTAVIIFLILCSVAYASRQVVYDMDFDVEASTKEAAPEACVKHGPGGMLKTMPADCKIPVENAKSIFISWNSVDDVLGIHTSTDWSINIRCIASEHDKYPPVNTEPSSTDYWEEDINLNDSYGGFALSPPGAYACKIRVDADDAAVAAPTIRVRVTY